MAEIEPVYELEFEMACDDSITPGTTLAGGLEKGENDAQI